MSQTISSAEIEYVVNALSVANSSYELGYNGAYVTHQESGLDQQIALVQAAINISSILASGELAPEFRTVG